MIIRPTLSCSHWLEFVCTECCHYVFLCECVSNCERSTTQCNFFTARVRSTREGTVFTSVCLFTLAGGGSHHRSGRGGGYPIPRSGWGVSHSQVLTGGTSSQFWIGEGYLIPRSGQGVPPSQVQTRGVPPSQVWTGGGTPGYPHPGQDRGYPPCPGQIPGQDGGDTPLPRRGIFQDWMEYSSSPGEAFPGLDGVLPLPCLGLDGVPPPPDHRETEQHSEHLLRGGRQVSCVHAGELSCSN